MNNKETSQTTSVPKKDKKLSFLILALAIILFIGFQFPDPYYFKGDFGLRKFLGLVLSIVKYVVPGILVVVWLLLWKRIITFQHLALASIGIIFSLILVIPLVEIFAVYKKDISSYHAVLQLTPPEIDSKKDSNKKTIYFMGGSTTEWTKKKADTTGKKRRWSEIVEANLNAKGINDYQTKFSAKSWYTTQHTRINYLSNIKWEKPDVVVVMHAINDILVNADFSYMSKGDFRNDYGHFLGPVDRMVRGGTVTGYVFDILKSSAFHFSRESITTNEFKGLVPYERNLRMLIKNMISDGIKPILMTQPFVATKDLTEEQKSDLVMLNFEAIGSSKRWSLETLINAFNVYNDKVRQIASEEGVALIDLESKIPKKFDIIYDEVHYTDKGHDLVAKVVSDEIARILDVNS